MTEAALRGRRGQMKVMNNIYAIILAGGEGTRFVPYSTPEMPKQFLHITDSGRTMIQQTYDRIRRFVPADRCFVSTNEKYRALVRKQLPDVPNENIIAEPRKKNTAPAIALACHLIHRRDPDAVTLFTPADHYIADDGGAADAFRKAAELAANGDTLVTFGILPTFPSPDYGYIKVGGSFGSTGAFIVSKFVEKPDVETAKKYIGEGKYHWNSGMFVWKAATLIESLKKHMPKMAAQLETLKTDAQGGAEPEWVRKFFDEVEGTSIDYGVMEKAANVTVFPFSVAWSDVGTWKGLADLAKRFRIALPEVVCTHLKEKIGS